MGYVNPVPRDPSTPLRFAQDDGYYRVSRLGRFQKFCTPFLCLGRSNCNRGREDKCRQAKLAKASFKNFAPEIGAILGLHPQIIARHGGVSVMTWRQLVPAAGQPADHDRYGVKETSTPFQHAPGFSQSSLRIGNVLQSVRVNNHID